MKKVFVMRLPIRNCNQFFRQTKAVKRFVRVNERVFKIINKGISGKLSKIQVQRKVFRVSRRGTVFQQERYRYPVNNAYLLRYRDYSLHYFNSKDKLANRVFVLPDYEQQKMQIKYMLDKNNK